MLFNLSTSLVANFNIQIQITSLLICNFQLKIRFSTIIVKYILYHSKKLPL